MAASAAPNPSPSNSATAVRLAEVLSALTYALDLTEGQRPGHTLRSAALAMRIGGELGLETPDLEALYYASLLKDSGCSSNASRMAALFGSDDQKVKGNMRLVDWHDSWRLALRTAHNCGVGRSPIARIRHFLTIARTPSMTREIIAARCNRGAQIARGLGFPASSSNAIAHVDEHWCGLGHPEGLSGVTIPLLSRILLIAQTFEVYWTERGIDTALSMIRGRSGTWFEPRLANMIVDWKRSDDWWRILSDQKLIGDAVLALEPGAAPLVATDERLDEIAYAFASVIDAKTPFTYRHSANVAAYAAAISAAHGSTKEEARGALRAGLLHDIGKLGISNRILDKPSRLTDEERAEVKRHPMWTWEILQRVGAFAPFARDAALHHERLDGSGYPWGVAADELGTTARILCIADVYEAITANRPYRAGMHPSEALGILMRDRGTAFDPELLDVTESLVLDGTLERVAAREHVL